MSHFFSSFGKSYKCNCGFFPFAVGSNGIAKIIFVVVSVDLFCSVVLLTSNSGNVKKNLIGNGPCFVVLQPLYFSCFLVYN